MRSLAIERINMVVAAKDAYAENNEDAAAGISFVGNMANLIGDATVYAL